MIGLREYQIDTVDRVLAEIEQERDPLVVAPTGAGKGLIYAEIIKRCPNKHVLIFVHRREIIRQIRDKLAEFGINAGLILAGEPMNLMARVQIASVQTLWSRCVRGKVDLPTADIVIIDEAHHARARTYQRIIASYPNAAIVGGTATPCRRDGGGLGNTSRCLIQAPQVEDLKQLGYLVGTRVFAPSTPDLYGRPYEAGRLRRKRTCGTCRSPQAGRRYSHTLAPISRNAGRGVVFATSVGSLNPSRPKSSSSQASRLRT